MEEVQSKSVSKGIGHGRVATLTPQGSVADVITPASPKIDPADPPENEAPYQAYLPSKNDVMVRRNFRAEMRVRGPCECRWTCQDYTCPETDIWPCQVCSSRVCLGCMSTLQDWCRHCQWYIDHGEDNPHMNVHVMSKSVQGRWVREAMLNRTSTQPGLERAKAVHDFANSHETRVAEWKGLTDINTEAQWQVFQEALEGCTSKGQATRKAQPPMLLHEQFGVQTPESGYHSSDDECYGESDINEQLAQEALYASAPWRNNPKGNRLFRTPEGIPAKAAPKQKQMSQAHPATPMDDEVLDVEPTPPWHAHKTAEQKLDKLLEDHAEQRMQAQVRRQVARSAESVAAVEVQGALTSPPRRRARREDEEVDDRMSPLPSRRLQKARPMASPPSPSSAPASSTPIVPLAKAEPVRRNNRYESDVCETDVTNDTDETLSVSENNSQGWGDWSGSERPHMEDNSESDPEYWERRRGGQAHMATFLPGDNKTKGDRAPRRYGEKRRGLRRKRVTPDASVAKACTGAGILASKPRQVLGYCFSDEKIYQDFLATVGFLTCLAIMCYLIGYVVMKLYGWCRSKARVCRHKKTDDAPSVGDVQGHVRKGKHGDKEVKQPVSWQERITTGLKFTEPFSATHHKLQQGEAYPYTSPYNDLMVTLPCGHRVAADDESWAKDRARRTKVRESAMATAALWSKKTADAIHSASEGSRNNQQTMERTESEKTARLDRAAYGSRDSPAQWHAWAAEKQGTADDSDDSHQAVTYDSGVERWRDVKGRFAMPPKSAEID